MRRLVPGLVVCLVALSLTVLALVFVTSPASRDDNGVSLTPAMGWSSWSFLRDSPTEASIEADAKAMKDSGLDRPTWAC
jgi:alpha-galactosidase